MTLDELRTELSEIDKEINVDLYSDGWMDIDIRIEGKLISIASIIVNEENWIQIYSNGSMEPEIYFKTINAFMKFANTKPEDRGIEDENQRLS